MTHMAMNGTASTFPASTMAALVAAALGTRPLDEAAAAVTSPIVNDLSGAMLRLLDAWGAYDRAPSADTKCMVFDCLAEVDSQRGLAGVKAGV